MNRTCALMRLQSINSTRFYRVMKVHRLFTHQELAAMADANDSHFFGHMPAANRQALTQAMQALVQHHQLKDIPTT